jgi:hypothetical protein
MKTISSFMLTATLLLLMGACKEVERRPAPGGAHLVVQDLPCAEVKKKILDYLERNKISVVREGQEPEIIVIGPVEAPPLPEDAFGRVEEKGRLELKCLDPVSTRLSVHMQVRGWTAEGRWLEIKDPDKLSAYGIRFLDRIVPKP